MAERSNTASLCVKGSKQRERGSKPARRWRECDEKDAKRKDDELGEVAQVGRPAAPRPVCLSVCLSVCLFQGRDAEKPNRRDESTTRKGQVEERQDENESASIHPLPGEVDPSIERHHRAPSE